ncbi:MAG: hypothetical protein ABF291_09010 [Desulfobacterales bacterium]
MGKENIGDFHSPGGMSDRRIDDPTLSPDLLGCFAISTQILSIGNRHQFVLLVEQINFSLAHMTDFQEMRQDDFKKIIETVYR